MLGIPYMGSKRKLAGKIIDAIIRDNPRAKYFYDLFGGGGSISLEALKRNQFEKVFYNEIDSGVVNLLKKIQTEGVTEEFYEWIDRETFHALKNGSDWKAGLVKTCWSFGNEGKGYIYGKEIENLKKSTHFYIIENGYLENRKPEIRIRLLKEFKEKEKIKNRFDLEHLERLQHLEHLQQLQQLEILNHSYENVKIETPIEETVIYLDPPYFGTATYQNDIDHEKLYNWIQNSPYTIYMSSYEAPFDVIEQFEHRCKFSPTKNNKVIEKLFCNKTSNYSLFSEAI